MKWLSIIGVVFLFNTSALAKNWAGSLFPDYKLQNQRGEWVTNASFKDSWVAYYFYPKNHTPGCSVEAAKFAENYNTLREMGVEVVGISLDDIESHQEFAKDYKVEFTLLSDAEKDLSGKLELVRYLPLPHTRRETLIVDSEGNIIKHYEDVDPNTHVEQIMKDVKVLKAQLSQKTAF